MQQSLLPRPNRPNAKAAGFLAFNFWRVRLRQFTDRLKRDLVGQFISVARAEFVGHVSNIPTLPERSRMTFFKLTHYRDWLLRSMSFAFRSFGIAPIF